MPANAMSANTIPANALPAAVQAMHVTAAPQQERWPACRAVLVIAGLSGGLWWGVARAVGWALS